MSKIAILALATAASALASAAAALAEEYGNGATTATAGPGTTDKVTEPAADAGTTKPKGTRGKPPEAPAAPANDTKPDTAAGGSSEGLTERLRALIQPLVEAGDGEKVKKVIAKYASCLKEIPADKEAAFTRDIEALTL